MVKRDLAVVVGCRGQDGRLISSMLLDRGYQVVGISRFETIGLGDLPHVDILDFNSVRKIVDGLKPTEVYYLAAVHSSSEAMNLGFASFDLYNRSHEVHVKGLLNFLECIYKFSPSTRLFYASSSLVFSGRHGEVQNELTPFDPVGIYGVTKAQGMWLCREYRDNAGIFASCGILYNHESHLRPASFLTAKIIRVAIAISAGHEEKLTVGSLDAMVDWGYAKQYVYAMKAVLDLNEPSDFIFASGSAHSVLNFIESVFNYMNLDWRKYVFVDENLLRRRQPIKIGDSSKLRRATGISLDYQFDNFVRQLVDDHLLHWSPTE